MELQFSKKELTCMRQLTDQMIHQEQTQELRLDESQQAVQRVLGVWGQVLLRGKQWNSDSVQVNGGVMVWVVYTGEDNVISGAQAWIPFQVRCDVPSVAADGYIQAQGFLRNLDARVITDRKLILRVGVDVHVCTYVDHKVRICCPENLPPQIRVLERTYPMLLPVQTGEKHFELNEELTLPGSCQPIQKLLRFSLQPELIDKKVMADKVVFRGTALVHVLYLGQDGQLYSWDFEIPFSEFTNLDDMCEEQAQTQLSMALTSLEMECSPQGSVYLKAGVVGQYLICDRKNISVVEDAYCTNGVLTANVEQLELLPILQMEDTAVRAEQFLEMEGVRMADVSFCPEPPAIHRDENGVQLDLNGTFQMLYYDREGMLENGVCHWNGNQYFQSDRDTHSCCQISPSGVAQASLSGTGAVARGDLLVSTMSTVEQKLNMITGVEWTQQEKCGKRPSLILRKAHGQSLWELAKATGSTVEAIQKANDLEDFVPEDRMLLIPVQ